LIQRLKKDANLRVSWPEFLRFFDASRGTGQAVAIIFRRIHEEEAAAAGAFQPPDVETGDILKPDGTWYDSQRGRKLPAPNSGKFSSAASLQVEDSLAPVPRARLRELRTRAMRDPALLAGWPRLDLSCLGLQDVPEWLYELDGVRELDLSRNRIRGLDESRMTRLCHTLRRIDFRHNLMGDLPHLLCMWPTGIELLFDQNPGTRCIRHALFYFRHSVHIW
jgi:hypothetical protein